MKKKCTKYEALFTFSSEEDFFKHLQECEDCRLEHEKMNKISSLVQEVKPYYIRKRKANKSLKIVASIALFAFLGTCTGIISMNSDISDTLKYGTTLSAEDYGFPVDSYGLIMVE